MIKRIKEINFIELLILLIIMFILIGIPLMMLYRYTFNIYEIRYFDYTNRSWILWWSVPVLFILYILDIIFNKKKISYIDILLYLLIILGAISTIFAVNTRTAKYGELTRNEGLLSLLSYYLILLNLKNMSNEKYKDIIIKTLGVIGIIQIIYGILQVYTDFSFILHFEISHMAFGLMGNPNFFGSYMVIVVSYAFSKYMLERKKKYLVLSVVFFMGLCLSSSTGPILSFFLVIVFFSIFYRKKIKWKDLLKIIILFILTYIFVVFSLKFVHAKLYNKEINPDYLSKEITNFDSSNIGNGRVNLWIDSLPLVKKYWAFGAGIDNFGIVYGSRGGLYFDKAHNVYLQILITNGIFALTIYMIILGIIFFKGLKLKETIYISLLMAFIGYCIQAFANISVIEVAPSFYIICGLLLSKIQKNELKMIK